MVAVAETSPGELPSVNQKQDSQAVPSGQDDLWVDADDMNILGGHVVSVMRALRATALVTGVAPATAGITDKAFRFTTIDTTTGLGRASTSLSTDLNKTWAAGVESLEGNGGSLSGTASNTGFFGVYAGLLSGTSGTFTAGSLYGLSAGGGLIAHVSGALPPIAIGLDAKTAYVDMGGRFLTDNSTLEFDASGNIKIKSGAVLTLGNTQINGTLDVTGAISTNGEFIIDNVTGGTGQFTIGGERKLADQFVGQSTMRGHNDADANTSYAQLLGKILDPAAGAEEGQYGIFTIQAGSLVESARFNADGMKLPHNNGADLGDGNAADQDLITVDEGTADANRPRIWWDESESCIAISNACFNVNGQPIQISGVTVIDSNRNFFHSSEEGITAGTTQTQADGFALTKDWNEIATCATEDDTVVLRLAVGGSQQFIINNGAERAQIFPGVGDDLGQGVDQPTTLAVGASTIFRATSATNWQESSQAGEGEMVFDNLGSLFQTASVAAGATLQFTLTVGDFAGIGIKGAVLHRITILPSAAITSFNLGFFELSSFVTASRSIFITPITNSVSSPTTYKQRGALSAINDDGVAKIYGSITNNGANPNTFQLGLLGTKLR